MNGLQQSVAIFSRSLPPVAPRRPAADALDLLDRLGAPITVAENGEIFREGDPASHCYRVASGAVRTIRLMEDGRRQISEFLLPGDLLAFDVLDQHDVSAEAVTGTVLRRFTRQSVETLSESNPALAKRLRETAAAKLRTARDQFLLLGRKTASERIASFLLQMAVRTRADTRGRIALPSRADMADHLGLTLETVSRTLSHLHRAGTIQVARALVAILDLPTLRDLACAPRH